MNMKKWIQDTIESKTKKAMPILSFPCISLMNITVKELINSSDLQADGMKCITDRVNSSASVSMMDLSVEAEAFGAPVSTPDYEVPAVTKAIVTCMDDAENLVVPQVGDKRTGIYIDAIKKAKELIEDRPVFAGVIGPFSLAGRLMDVTEIMVSCYTEPETVHITMNKATDFLIEYIKAYKNAGANGVVMAEPLTGLLSCDLATEFSEPYVRRIIDSVQDDEFIVVYHNCGNNAIGIIQSILRVNACAYHFGNAVSISEVMKNMPKDVLVMGNIDPAGQFLSGTEDSIRNETLNLMKQLCAEYPNFIISSGCDIPPNSSWGNIDAFFNAVDDFYKGNF